MSIFVDNYKRVFMKIISKLLSVIMLMVALQACQGSVNKQTGGTLIGGVAGGLLGAQFGKGEGKLVATGVGALAGALIGSEVGKTLDEYDKQMVTKTSQQALEYSPSGKTVAWQNPDSGNSGNITPVRTYKSDDRYCREYVQEIMVGGEKQKAYGKACRKEDGHWEIVK